ncbi:MAG: GMC family oxidoreductase [Caulobacterales bacterium]|nr:GMC family oxidoreductase [Caulobacterales bacterium]
MIVDFNDPETPDALSADLCIVGSGAAGITLAREFIGARTRVLLIESGGEAVTPDADDLNRCEIAGLPFEGDLAGRARVFGGTTTAWHGQSLPLDPIDFEKRDWVPDSGWPFGIDALAPYYERAERLLFLEGMRYNERGWDYVGVTPPPLAPDAVGCQMSWLSNRRDFAELYGDELRRAANVTVVTNATAVEVLLTANGQRAHAIALKSPSGRDGAATAPRFALAVGAIETARLLLASRSVDPRGVANTRDVVGRYFQDHPTAHVLEITPRDEAAFAHYYRPHYRRWCRLFPKAPLAAPAQRRLRVMNATAEMVYTPPDGSALASVREFYEAIGHDRRPPSLRQALSAAGGVGELTRHAYDRFVRKRSPTAPGSRITLMAHIEQAPDRDSRVTLGQEADATSMPRAKIDWRLNDLDHATFLAFAETVAGEMRRAGLGDATVAPWLSTSDWRAEVADFYHHIGTARMGEDPATSVVDAACKTHDVDNLYIASAAVFPTGGASNPTLTIIALALRLAEHLKAEER